METVIYPSRHDLAKTFTGVGVEVGVAYGSFSDYILFHSKCTRLYSLDPWDINHVGFPAQEEADIAYNITRSLLSKYGDRSHIVRLDSAEFVDLATDAYYDFVYIDASHILEETVLELQAWWEKLKPGGRLCGHDFKNGATVSAAVRGFAAQRNLDIFLTEEDFCSVTPTNSFILFKP